LNNGTSRRDFFKAAVAASLTGVVSSAEETAKAPGPAPQASRRQSPREKNPPPARARYPRVFTGRHLNASPVLWAVLALAHRPRGTRQSSGLADLIQNRPDTGNNQELTLPAFGFRPPAATPTASSSSAVTFPYDTGENGFWPSAVPGLPRLAEAKFFSSFPLPRIEFEDPDCPVRVALEAFSPFQPLDADASGLPCAVLTYQVPQSRPSRRRRGGLVAVQPGRQGHQTQNDARTATGISGVFMSNSELPADDPLQGSFVLAALPPVSTSAQLLSQWTGDDLNAGINHFWFDEFARAAPRCTRRIQVVRWFRLHSPANPAGATRSFRFLFAWHFPNRTPERCGWDAPQAKRKPHRQPLLHSL